MANQYTALTGRRLRRPYLDIINAQLPSLPQYKETERSYDLQKKSLRQDEQLRLADMEAQQEYNDRLYAYQQEADRIARQQGLIGTGINAAALGVQAYPAIKSLIGGGSAAAASPGVASAPAAFTPSLTTGTGEVIGNVAAGEAAKTGTAAAAGFTTPSLPGIGLAAGLEYARKPLRSWADDQLPAGKHLANIGIRAGQGYALGGPVGGIVGAGAGMFEASPTLATGGLALPFDKQGQRELRRIRDQIGDIGQDVIDWVKDPCIIVTACCGRDSLGVMIAREYRDRFADRKTLRGYYMIAEVIVPVMVKSKKIRAWVKNHIVDRLCVYGLHRLNEADGKKHDWKPDRKTELTAKGFLFLCRAAGSLRKFFRRSVTGEVV